MDKEQFTNLLADQLKDMWLTGYNTAVSALRAIADSEQMRPEQAPYLRNAADFLDAVNPSNYGKVDIIPILEMMGVDAFKIQDYMSKRAYDDDDNTG